ncbi:MAG: hypothetical protein JWR54_195 [Mucilaginibacter sp.]|nr:hypothetical protein [Mucilaginibacter sp.]
MPKNNLPTYAIVELLIRLEKHDPAIGGYKNHSESDNGIIVKTTGGSILFPQALIMQQFESPELIGDNELAAIASLFRSAN